MVKERQGGEGDGVWKNRKMRVWCRVICRRSLTTCIKKMSRKRDGMRYTKKKRKSGNRRK